MKFFDWFKPRNWGWMKVYRDFENFVDWRKTILREQANAGSKFNLWKLQRTKLFDVYVTVSLDELDSQLTEIVQKTKVIEMISPLNRYLDTELGFAECLDIELNQFVDDQQKPTLTYLVVYRFRWNKFSIFWLLKFLAVNAILVTLIIKFNIIPTIIQWVSSLT